MNEDLYESVKLIQTTIQFNLPWCNYIYKAQCTSTVSIMLHYRLHVHHVQCTIRFDTPTYTITIHTITIQVLQVQSKLLESKFCSGKVLQFSYNCKLVAVYRSFIVEECVDYHDEVVAKKASHQYINRFMAIEQEDVDAVPTLPPLLMDSMADHQIETARYALSLFRLVGGAKPASANGLKGAAFVWSFLVSHLNRISFLAMWSHRCILFLVEGRILDEGGGLIFELTLPIAVKQAKDVLRSIMTTLCIIF